MSPASTITDIDDKDDIEEEDYLQFGDCELLEIYEAYTRLYEHSSKLIWLK